jgi:hypothetical protein
MFSLHNTKTPLARPINFKAHKKCVIFNATKLILTPVRGARVADPVEICSFWTDPDHDVWDGLVAHVFQKYSVGKSDLKKSTGFATLCGGLRSILIRLNRTRIHPEQLETA